MATMGLARHGTLRWHTSFLILYALDVPRLEGLSHVGTESGDTLRVGV